MGDVQSSDEYIGYYDEDSEDGEDGEDSENDEEYPCAATEATSMLDIEGPNEMECLNEAAPPDPCRFLNELPRELRDKVRILRGSVRVPTML